MTSTKEFPLDFAVGTGTDYGSINNSPDHFTVTLFSNDRHVERVTEESSVRARFRTRMIAPFTFRGPWQVRLNELSVCNKQSMVLTMEVHDSLKGDVWKMDLGRRVYENMWDVFEECTHVMSLLHMPRYVRVPTDMHDETIEAVMIGDVLVRALDRINIPELRTKDVLSVQELWNIMERRVNSEWLYMLKNIVWNDDGNPFGDPRDLTSKVWPSRFTFDHLSDISTDHGTHINFKWGKPKVKNVHEIMIAENRSSRPNEFRFFHITVLMN